jgi:hypothetical protein
VAIGVSGDVHSVQGSPMSQVPASLGPWHLRNVCAMLIWQQSCPGAQHTEPQHAAPQSLMPHGGVEHLPNPQKGCGPAQTVPHAPQLLMSFASLTQRPLQQFRRQPHWESVVQPPPVPDDELLDDVTAELLDDVAVEDVVVLAAEVVAFVRPPPWPPTASSVRAPHAAANTPRMETEIHALLRSTERLSPDEPAEASTGRRREPARPDVELGSASEPRSARPSRLDRRRVTLVNVAAYVRLPIISPAA